LIDWAFKQENKEQVKRQKKVPPAPVIIKGEKEYKVVKQEEKTREIEIFGQMERIYSRGRHLGKEGKSEKLIEEYEDIYEENARRIREDNRGELPKRYMAKLLYRWNDGKFEEKYLKKLERSWRQWKEP